MAQPPRSLPDVQAFLAREDAPAASKIDLLVSFLAVDAPSPSPSNEFVDPLDAERAATQAQIDQLVDSLSAGAATVASAKASPILISSDYEDPLTAKKEEEAQQIDQLLNKLTSGIHAGANTSDLLLSDEFVDTLDTERESREQTISHLLDQLSPSTAAASPMLLARDAKDATDSFLHLAVGAMLLLVVAVVLGVVTKRSERAARKVRDDSEQMDQQGFEYLLFE